MAVLNLTEANFNEEALNAPQTVLIDFWASWCGPCKMLSPIVDEIADSEIANLKVCKVNVDEQASLASQFGVMSIPTLVVLKNGKEVNRSVGVVPKQAILNLVK